MPSDPAPDERLLGTIERESSIVLDREGRFWHDGSPVEHARLAAALHRWIDRDPESGRYVLRAGPQWCFITVEDAPFQVVGVSMSGTPPDTRVEVTLSDGATEELAYGTLRQRPDNALYCDVKHGGFTARFQRNAYFKIGELVVLRDGEPCLPAAGRDWRIELDPGSAP